MQNSLEVLFHPQSVAVIGASENPSTYGYFFMDHMLDYGFKGQIYPINPKVTEIMGIKAYPSLDDVPGTVDYVIHGIGVSP